MIGRTLAVAAILVVLAGCGSDPTSPSAGTVSVFLTDAPIDLSTVSAVEVKRPLLFAESPVSSTFRVSAPA